MLSGMFDIICSVSETPNKTTQLAEQINNVKMQQSLIDDLFNLSDDEDLIEACCYQTKAFSAYYRYLLRQVREGAPEAGFTLEKSKTERLGGFVG